MIDDLDHALCHGTVSHVRSRAEYRLSIAPGRGNADQRLTAKGIAIGWLASELRHIAKDGGAGRRAGREVRRLRRTRRKSLTGAESRRPAAIGL